MNYPKQDISGVILAGGQGTRMGGQDKGLVKFQNRPLIEHIIEKISPQVKEIIINANRNTENYKQYGFGVVGDTFQGSQGPLAGMASSLAVTSTPLLITVPCDSPFLPSDLVARLYLSLLEADADLSVVNSGRLQPVFCLLKKELLPSLSEFLADGGRKIDKWHKQLKVAYADFSDVPNCFININSHEELKALEHSD